MNTGGVLMPAKEAGREYLCRLLESDRAQWAALWWLYYPPKYHADGDRHSRHRTLQTETQGTVTAGDSIDIAGYTVTYKEVACHGMIPRRA